MTTFPINWDSAFNSEPADNENINLGAGRIRDLKSAVQLREQVDHSWAGDANDGKHIKSEYMAQGGDPAIDAGDGAVYTKVTGGNTELYYKDSLGNIVQITSVGSTRAFPSGTTMTFLQAAPPVGWVQRNDYNDLMVRLVNDASGGARGGSWNITGLNGITDAHTLAVSEIPQHTHNVTVAISPATNVAGGGTSVPTSGGTVLTTDGGTGGGAGHTHTLTNSLVGDGAWRPAYANMCVGIKS